MDRVTDRQPADEPEDSMGGGRDGSFFVGDVAIPRRRLAAPRHLRDAAPAVKGGSCVSPSVWVGNARRDFWYYRIGSVMDRFARLGEIATARSA
jgi:hypothetical protein